MAELNWNEMISMTGDDNRPICIALHGINDTLNEIRDALRHMAYPDKWMVGPVPTAEELRLMQELGDWPSHQDGALPYPEDK